MKITCWGAAGEVTGSQHLIETKNLRLLLDCGFFQGRRKDTRFKNEQFHCKPKKLDGVVLSHAHIDHSGNLPGLYKAGYRGPIFCTAATADVAEIMLKDSAGIQKEDARYLGTHLKGDHPPLEPLYTDEHVAGVVKLFETLECDQWHELSSEVRIRLSDAGHILGSTITELDIRDAGDVRRVVFTGDLGRRGLPLLKDPTLIEGCEILICESTYGNRVHKPPQDLKNELLRIIKEAVAVEGKVVIPAFSLGRTQQIVYFLNELTNEGLMPSIPIFVDSPLSRRLTNVYRRHKYSMDDEVQELLTEDYDPFGFQGLTYVANRSESMELNRRKGPFVVIAASGMCENGRVRHHLKHAVSSINNTIVIIGYQAQHTLGRRIVERQPTLKFFDRQFPLKAKVETLSGLSAHADVEDFKWWFEHMASHGGVGQALLVHGEPEASKSLAAVIRDYCDEDPILPEFGKTYEL